jgi:pilus assembly protein Flp/PilA
MLARLLVRFLANRSGATAVEYGLLATFIALAMIAGAMSLGSTIGNEVFQSLADRFNERPE